MLMNIDDVANTKHIPPSKFSMSPHTSVYLLQSCVEDMLALLLL